MINVIVHILCKAGKDVNAAYVQRNAPLNLALEMYPKVDQREVILTPIQYGADVIRKNSIGRSPFDNMYCI